MMQSNEANRGLTSSKNIPLRIASIDIFRGMVMFLMLLEMVHIDSVAKNLQSEATGIGKSFWETIYFHTTHVAWEGCSLHDLIQPSFTFLVGSAMAFSLWKRIAMGQSRMQMFGHAILRSFILVSLGVLLRSLNTDQIAFRFDDTLCQIGLGYTFLFLIALLPQKVLYISIPFILVLYWGAFVAYPLPPADFDYSSVGVSKDWPHHFLGFEAHWNKNSNLAWAVDRWWMNLFPRKEYFSHSDGGYTTLNFVPTLVTMLLGLLAGNWLRGEYSTSRRIALMGASTLLCLGIAAGVDAAGWCPIVKRIWTPTWVLWSGGWCFAFLLGFYLIADVKRWQNWAYPLTVVGSNSIAAYVMSYTTAPFFEDRLTVWFNPIWKYLDYSLGTPTPVVVGAITFILIWLILYWLNKNRMFIRI